jgi:membrane protein DedA with SNARE-associated domain
MSTESLIVTYGYPVLFLGGIFEGETFLIIGAFLAHRGYLSLPAVMAIALVSSLMTDQTAFWLGKTRGREFLDRRPKWQARAKRVLDELERHNVLLSVTFRFLYGLRFLTPFVIGMTGFPRRRFLPLNIVGALIWVGTIGLAGYVFGHVVEIFLQDMRRYELWIALAVFVVGTLGAAGYWMRKRGGTQKEKQARTE